MKPYKGYTGKVEYDPEDKVYHGRVAYLDDVVTFVGETLEEAQEAFRDSVDDYLEWCRKLGRKPDKPCSGRIALRVDPNLHRRLVDAARRAKLPVSTFVAQCLSDAVKGKRSEAGDSAASRR